MLTRGELPRESLDGKQHVRQFAMGDGVIRRQDEIIKGSVPVKRGDGGALLKVASTFAENAGTAFGPGQLGPFYDFPAAAAAVGADGFGGHDVLLSRGSGVEGSRFAIQLPPKRRRRQRSRPPGQ